MTLPHLFIFGLGYTATALAHKALAQGWRVSGTTRSEPKAEALRAAGIKTYRFDAQTALPQDALTGVTHLVQSIPPDDSGDLLLAQHADLLKQMTGLRWLAYLSTTVVYGDHDGAWVDEDSPPRNPSARGQKRLAAEAAWQALGLPLHIFRLAGIYGPGRNALDKAERGQSRIIDKPGQVFSRIHRDDIVDALLTSALHPDPQYPAIYNLCDSEPAAPGEVTRFAHRLLGLPEPKAEPLADAQLSPMARSFYADNKRVSNAKFRRVHHFRFRYPSYRHGLSALAAQRGAPRRFQDLAALPKEARGAVVAIGNFDGLHLGHQALLASARALADKERSALAVLTFEPHPRQHFAPDAPPFRLSDAASKAKLLAASGVDLVYELPFDAARAEQPAEAFIQDLLVGALQTRALIVGEDFHFGQHRLGSIAMLQEQAPFPVTAVTLTQSEGRPISSSQIRDRLRSGDFDAAAAMLGRRWRLAGQVVRGDQLGRELGFPTANLEVAQWLQLKLGIYAAWAWIDAQPGKEPTGLKRYKAAVSLGKRPSVAGEDIRFEVHLLDFSGDLYGQRLEVEPFAYLHGEKHYEGLDALKAGIAKDVETVRHLLAAHPPEHPAALR